MCRRPGCAEWSEKTFNTQKVDMVTNPSDQSGKETRRLTGTLGLKGLRRELIQHRSKTVFKNEIL